MFTRETAIQHVNAFLRACADSNIAIRQAVLFGSVASGTNTQDSDIDLLLVSEQFSSSIWQNAKLLAPVNKHFTEIEVHPISTTHFAEGDPFIREALRGGIQLL